MRVLRADGTLIGQCQGRHRHQEWLKFLQLINAQTPSDRDLHLILDNYATHKHPKVQKWLAKHPRFHLHFTPTSASWLNMVERFFRDLTLNRLRRGAFHSVPELVAALEKYIAQHNREPSRSSDRPGAGHPRQSGARPQNTAKEENVTLIAKHCSREPLNNADRTM